MKTMAGNPYDDLEGIARKAGISMRAAERAFNDISKVYLGVMTSEDPDPVKYLVQHYDGMVIPEEIKKAIPALERGKSKLISAPAQPSPSNNMYPEFGGQTQSAQAPQQPASSGTPEIKSKEMALQYVIDALSMVNQNQKNAVLNFFRMIPVYQENPQSLLMLLTGILGQNKGYLAWQNYMLISQQYQQQGEEQMNMIPGMMPGMPGAPNLLNLAAGGGGGGAVNPLMAMMGGGQHQQQNPQMQQMMEMMKFQQMMKTMEDDKVDKQIKNMYQIVMMNLVARTMGDQGGQQGGANKLAAMMGGIPMAAHIEKDQQGNVVKEVYTPIQAQQNANQPSWEMIMKMMGDQTALMFNAIKGNDSTKEYKDLMLQFMQLSKPNYDPLEMLNKFRSAVPEMFNKGSAPPEQYKMELDAKLAVMDRQMDLERWRQEQLDKAEDKKFQHQSMNKYVDSLRDVGMDILKPAVSAFAEGVRNRAASPPPQPQQPMQQAPQQQQQEQQLPPMPDLSKMSEEEFAQVEREKEQTARQLQAQAGEIQRRVMLVEQERARRNAANIRNHAQMQASTNFAVGNDDDQKQTTA